LARVRFDGFIYDPAARQLLRGESEVHLGPKAFELLGALLKARPRALAKVQLQAQLWPRTAVVEANLTNLWPSCDRRSGTTAECLATFAPPTPVSEGEARLEDLGSKNGTWLRKKRIKGPVPLADGDEIRLGRVHLVFRASIGSDETKTEEQA
jgi:hypothetical protein